jgi:hypothetical protein
MRIFARLVSPNSPIQPRIRVRAVTLSCMMLGLIVGTYYIGMSQGLDRRLPERYRVYGIPIAVSMDLYGLKGYVAYTAIERRFVNDKPVDVILSDDLPRSQLGQFGRAAMEHPEELSFVPADDKGDVTFTRAAFHLFGANQASLYRLYFLLLLGSVAAFVAVFIVDSSRLFLGVCIALAFMTFPSAFQDGLLPPHVVTFYDPRVFGVIAVWAIVHLGFASIEGHRNSMVAIGCAMYQTALVVFAVHIRSANIWLVFALVTWLGMVLAIEMMKNSTRLRISAVFRTSFPNGLWCVFLVLLGLSGLSIWEKTAYDPAYFTSKMPHHLLWHNVGLGFALHPSLGGPLDHQITDEAMMNQVAHHLVSRGQMDVVNKLFGSSYAGHGDDLGTVTVAKFLSDSNSDLARYDHVARDIVVETTRRHPLETAALFLYYKPRSLLAHLLWFTAFLRYDQPLIQSNGVDGLVLQTSSDWRQRKVYFAPMTLTSIAILSVASALAWPLCCFRQTVGLVVTILVCSTVPSLLTYPVPLVMGESLFVLSVLSHVCVGSCGLALMSMKRWTR